LQRQFSRYTPKTGRSEGLTAKLPEILNRKQLLDYADDVAKEARKLPRIERYDYVIKRFMAELNPKDQREALIEIKKKGVLKYD